MMKIYVALFRGINVGGKNILPMKPLVVLLENYGLKNIKTYIQTGNVVFQSETNSYLDIADSVEAEFGFKPQILILEANNFKLCAENNPYVVKEGKFVHCYFCMAKPELNKSKVDQLLSDTEEYSLVGDVLYLYAPEGVGGSKLVKNIEACLGIYATGRNLNTVNKIVSLLD